MNALDALYRCQRAWEATQPQLFMELYPDVGLDDEHGLGEHDPGREAVLVVEPAALTADSPGGGLGTKAGCRGSSEASDDSAPNGAEGVRRAKEQGERPRSRFGNPPPASSLWLNPGDVEPCRAHAHRELTVPGAAPSYPSSGLRDGSASPFIYSWGNNEKRATLKGRSCRVIANGRMNSVLVEFDNGQREVVSRRALRNQTAPGRTGSTPIRGRGQEVEV